jgi:hypothetical protein
MEVNGREVAQEVIDKCIFRMKSAPFKASEIETICANMGVESRHGSAMRLADRLIQRERKSGNIELKTRPYWFWVPA